MGGGQGGGGPGFVILPEFVTSGAVEPELASNSIPCNANILFDEQKSHKTFAHLTAKQTSCETFAHHKTFAHLTCSGY